MSATAALVPILIMGALAYGAITEPRKVRKARGKKRTRPPKTPQPCKYGPLSKPVKTPSGRTRRCKLKP